MRDAMPDLVGGRDGTQESGPVRERDVMVNGLHVAHLGRRRVGAPAASGSPTKGVVAKWGRLDHPLRFRGFGFQTCLQ